MKKRKQNKIILILGRTGSGKSTLVKQEIIPRLRRCVIFDPMHEYNGGAVVSNYESVHELLKKNWARPRFKIVCRYDTLEEYAETINLVLEVGNIQLVIEELNYFLSCWSKDEAFLDVVRFGRHHGIDVIAIAQRAAEIPKLYTSQAHIIISFQQTEGRDIKYLASCGLIGDEGAARVKALPRLKNIKDFNKKYFIIFSN